MVIARTAAWARCVLLCSVLVGSLAACSDDNNTATQPPAPPGPQTIGGTVTGLAGTGLVLQNNTGDDLALAANGSFTFATSLASGAAYAVTVKTQPSVPAQRCTVANGTGVVGVAAITNVTVSCAALVPRFAYAAPVTAAATQLPVFSVDPGTGTLTAVASAATASPTQFLELSADGRFLYWNERTTNTIGAASIDAGTGALTALAGSPFPAGGSSPRSLALAAGGKFLLSIMQTSNTVTVQSVDAATGALTLVGSPVATGSQPVSLTVTPNGKFAYVGNATSANVSAYAVDAGTGALMALPGSPYAVSGTAVAVTVEPRGRFLYVANQNVNLISAFAIDPATGALIAVPGSPFTAASAPGSLATDPAGKYLYVAQANNNVVRVFTIDATTGALAEILGSPFGTDPLPNFVAMDPGGKFILVGTSGTIRTHTIDPGTGGLTLGMAVTGLAGAVFGIKILPQ
jgi:6-phosphogluconolactonase (cycloisomerase 2 family)